MAAGTGQSQARPGNRPGNWFVYILRCSNGCLYTGITTDVPKRLAVHNAGTGSAYVRAHRPAVLVSFTACENRSAASVLEYAVKSLKKAEKLALAETWKSAGVPGKPRRGRLGRAASAGVSH